MFLALGVYALKTYNFNMIYLFTNKWDGWDWPDFLYLTGLSEVLLLQKKGKDDISKGTPSDSLAPNSLVF